MERSVETLGGESSSEEMCLVVIQYYPLVSGFTSCSDYGGYVVKFKFFKLILVKYSLLFFQINKFLYRNAYYCCIGVICL